jgi:hypothetical protein
VCAFILHRQAAKVEKKMVFAILHVLFTFRPLTGKTFVDARDQDNVLLLKGETVLKKK